MPNALTISLPQSDTLTSRLTFKLHVAGDSRPAGLEIVVNLDGTGSLASGHDAKQVRREPDADGNAEVVWYRRGIFGRAINANLEAESTDPAIEVSVELVENSSSEANWISYSQPTRNRLRL